MDQEGRRKDANEYLQRAYREQMDGNVEEAIRLYKASLSCLPTAEAYTLLGWGYSFLGKYDEAIEECKKAIRIDPAYGNPYNDIGSYLINKGEHDAAVPWLEQALAAPRYEPRHYPHCNLGRVYRAKGWLLRALQEFQKALALNPDYDYAHTQIKEIQAVLH